jgi:hypothetical protein
MEKLPSRQASWACALIAYLKHDWLQVRGAWKYFKYKSFTYRKYLINNIIDMADADVDAHQTETRTKQGPHGLLPIAAKRVCRCS